jgi:hypothetical protein
LSWYCIDKAVDDAHLTLQLHELTQHLSPAVAQQLAAHLHDVMSVHVTAAARPAGVDLSLDEMADATTVSSAVAVEADEPAPAADSDVPVTSAAAATTEETPAAVAEIATDDVIVDEVGASPEDAPAAEVVEESVAFDSINDNTAAATADVIADETEVATEEPINDNNDVIADETEAATDDLPNNNDNADVITDETEATPVDAPAVEVADEDVSVSET